MLVTDGYTQVSWGLHEQAMNDTDEVLLNKFSKFIESEKKKARFLEESRWVKHEVKIYRSLKDFNIGVAVTLDDIKED